MNRSIATPQNKIIYIVHPDGDMARNPTQINRQNTQKYRITDKQ